MYLQRSTEYNPICFDLCVENEIDSMNNFDLNQSKLANNETKQKKVADCHDFKMKYKTEICRYWTEYGFCNYGDNCAFAHGLYEIRRKPIISNNYKTKKCKNFHENGYCTYGFRCQFLHNVANYKVDVKCSISYFHFFENIENYLDEKLTIFQNQKIQKKRLPAFKDMTETKQIQQLNYGPECIVPNFYVLPLIKT